MPPVMEEIVVPMSQISKETVEAGSFIPHGRVQQRTVEHVPVPQILKETVEVALYHMNENDSGLSGGQCLIF